MEERRKLRVLVLIKGLGAGGAERLLVSALPHLDRARFDYEYAYLLPWKDAFAPEIEASGLPVHCLGSAIRWISNIRELVRSRQIDLVHVHSPMPAVIVRTLLGPRSPKIVYTEHNTWDRFRVITKVSNMLTFPRNAHVFAVSAEVERSFRYPRFLRFLRMPPHETLHHGLDALSIGSWATHDGIRAELGIPDEVPIVGTIANFKAHKAYDKLLEAALKVRQSVPGVRFVCVGQGLLEDETRQLAHELDLDDTILFTGYRPDAPRIANAFDVFVLSSKHEGLPIALLEAMALGKPSVVTAVGGLPEVVTDAKDSFVVPAGDTEALAGKIVALLNDPALRRQMGEAARARAADFDIRTAVGRMEQVYVEVGS